MKTVLNPHTRLVVFQGSPAQLQAWMLTQRATKAPRPSKHRSAETRLAWALVVLFFLALVSSCTTSRRAPLYAKHPHSYPTDARVRHAEPWPSRVR